MKTQIDDPAIDLTESLCIESKNSFVLFPMANKDRIWLSYIGLVQSA